MDTVPKVATFEWSLAWEELAPHLCPAALGLEQGGAAAPPLIGLPVLVVGSGTSTLSADLHASGSVQMMRALAGAVWRGAFPGGCACPALVPRAVHRTARDSAAPLPPVCAH